MSQVEDITWLPHPTTRRSGREGSLPPRTRRNPCRNKGFNVYLSGGAEGIRTPDPLTARRTQKVLLTFGYTRKHPLTGGFVAQQLASFRDVFHSLADSPRTLERSDGLLRAAKPSIPISAWMSASQRRPLPNPLGERRNRVLVSGSGRQIEDDTSADLAVFVPRRRGPGESVAETEIDHAHEPDPLVSVREWVVLDDARAQNRSLDNQIGIELDTTERSTRCMQCRLRQLKARDESYVLCGLPENQLTDRQEVGEIEIVDAHSASRSRTR